MMTREDVKNILNKMKDEHYNVIAIRHLSDDENYNIGDICRNSYEWNYEYDFSSYGTDNEIEFDGTCGYDLTRFDYYDPDDAEDIEEAIKDISKALEESACYFGEAVLISGNGYSYGNDENEVIIEGAEVLYKF